MNSPAAGRSLAGAAARAVLAATGLALVFVVGAEFRSLKAARQEAFAWLARTGVTLDAAAIGREPDAERVRLRAARAVLAAELYPSRHQGIPPQQAARESAERLAEAAAAGREIFARRSASWEAALVQGAATYLSCAQARDPRLFTAYREWEAPLEAALRLAPTKREPARFLAAAYLEIWPALSPRKRETARGLLTEVFREPQDLARLLGPWLDTAADRREAFSVLPDDPLAWKQVADAYARRADLPGFAAARSRGEQALLATLRRDLLEADRLRGDGRLGDARGLYLSVAERARPEARYLGLVERALERCPPGPVDRQTAERLAPHFVRALDRCLLAGCEINPTALKRLSRFMRDLPPHQAALAAVYTDDLSRVGLYERQAQGLDGEPWAPYLVAKARRLAARGRVDEAREALSRVNPTWHRQPLYWLARAEVARAAGDAGGLTEALARLAAMGRSTWQAPDWTWHRNVARLEMFVRGPANGLGLVLDSVPASGALVELRLDGGAVGAFPVRRVVGTATSLRLAAPVGHGLHVLELESLDGGQVLPGRVELR